MSYNRIVESTMRVLQGRILRFYEDSGGETDSLFVKLLARNAQYLSSIEQAKVTQPKFSESLAGICAFLHIELATNYRSIKTPHQGEHTPIVEIPQIKQQQQQKNNLQMMSILQSVKRGQTYIQSNKEPNQHQQQQQTQQQQQEAQNQTKTAPDYPQNQGNPVLQPRYQILKPKGNSLVPLASSFPVSRAQSLRSPFSSNQPAPPLKRNFVIQEKFETIDTLTPTQIQLRTSPSSISAQEKIFTQTSGGIAVNRIRVNTPICEETMISRANSLSPPNIGVREVSTSKISVDKSSFTNKHSARTRGQLVTNNDHLQKPPCSKGSTTSSIQPSNQQHRAVRSQTTAITFIASNTIPQSSEHPKISVTPQSQYPSKRAQSMMPPFQTEVHSALIPSDNQSSLPDLTAIEIRTYTMPSPISIIKQLPTQNRSE